MGWCSDNKWRISTLSGAVLCIFALGIAAGVASRGECSSDPANGLLIWSLALLGARVVLYATIAYLQIHLTQLLSEGHGYPANLGQGAYSLSSQHLKLAQGCSPYLWLSILLGLCWVLWLCEFCTSVAFLHYVVLGQCDPSRGLSIAAVTVWWASLCCRAFSPSLPLRWRIVFARIASTGDQLSFLGLQEVWRAHHRARFASCFRIALSCVCRPDYLCGEKGRMAVLPALCEQDELAAAATTLAYLTEYRCSSRNEGSNLCEQDGGGLFGQGPGGGVSHSHAFALLGELLHNGESSKQEKADYKASNSSAGLIEWEHTSLEKALKLNKFAIAAYTGMLLDVPRYPCCCCFGWIWSCGSRPCHRAYLDVNKSGVVHGDNCLGGHQHKFQRYVDEWGESLIVHHGHVRQGACQVAFFLAERTVSSGAKEVIISIRGTQDIFDTISDALMCGAALHPNDLGLSAEESGSGGDGGVEDLGHCHLGVLLATRALERSLVQQLDEIVYGLLSSDSTRPLNIWVCGHSLAGAVASMLSLRLQSRPYVQSSSAIVTALAYQPLPTLDANALRISNEAHPRAVLAMVSGDDIVSRLSIGNLERLSSRILRIAEEEKAEEPARGTWFLSVFCRHWFYRLYFVFSLAFRCLVQGRDKVRAIETRHGRAKGLSNEPRSDYAGPTTDCGADVASNAGGATDADSEAQPDDRQDDRTSFLVGAVVHVKRVNLSDSSNEHFIAERIPNVMQAECLTDIILSKNTFADHMPWRLADGLARALEFKFVKKVGSEEASDITEFEESHSERMQIV